MQHDIDTVATSRPVSIFGVNGIGEESGNSVTCQGRTIPWLQDVGAVNVWQSWQVTYRDVIVLDHDNKVIRIYNLTTNDLADSAKYAALRGILLDASR